MNTSESLSNPSPSEKPSWAPSRGGALIFGGLILFGLIILGGLYVAPKAYAPAPPINYPQGAPSVRLRFVAYDLACQKPKNEPMLLAIQKLDPDYILLQDVNEDDVVEIGEFFKMQKTYHPQLYQRSEHLAGKRGLWGNLVLSKQLMYSGAPVGSIRGGCGVQARSVVQEKQFTVASLHLATGTDGQKEASELEQDLGGNRPTVLAALASDSTPPAMPAFLKLARSVQSVSLYISGDWQIVAQGTAPTAGSGLAPQWIDVAAATK